MHTTTLLDMPPEEQAQMLTALRRARYGYLLALHILLLTIGASLVTNGASLISSNQNAR